MVVRWRDQYGFLRCKKSVPSPPPDGIYDSIVSRVVLNGCLHGRQASVARRRGGGAILSQVFSYPATANIFFREKTSDFPGFAEVNSPP